jgi:mannosyltransferase OCH1-like enzyme
MDARRVPGKGISIHEQQSDEFMTERIPKRIIQTDKSADFPLLSKAAVVNLRLLNPDFEYLFFDDAQVENFIDSEYRGRVRLVLHTNSALRLFPVSCGLSFWRLLF